MAAWIENRFEDRANRLLRAVILRERCFPDVIYNMREEASAAEWVCSYLGSLGIEGEPMNIAREYFFDCQKLTKLAAGSDVQSDGGSDGST
jgi:hypothetical protein